MTSLISAALGARVHFPQALACHMSTCLPAHVAVPAASSGWGAAGVGGSGEGASFSALHSSHLQQRFCQDAFPADWFPSPAFFFLTNTQVRLDKAQHLSKEAA